MRYKGAPSLWQRNMNKDVLLPLRKNFAAWKSLPSNDPKTNVIHIYMDDILLAMRDVKEHLWLLEALFKLLAQLHLTVSIHKSFIRKRELDMLGTYHCLYTSKNYLHFIKIYCWILQASFKFLSQDCYYSNCVGMLSLIELIYH